MSSTKSVRSRVVRQASSCSLDDIQLPTPTTTGKTMSFSSRSSTKPGARHSKFLPQDTLENQKPHFNHVGTRGTPKFLTDHHPAQHAERPIKKRRLNGSHGIGAQKVKVSYNDPLGDDELSLGGHGPNTRDRRHSDNSITPRLSGPTVQSRRSGQLRAEKSKRYVADASEFNHLQTILDPRNDDQGRQASMDRLNYTSSHTSNDLMYRSHLESRPSTLPRSSPVAKSEVQSPFQSSFDQTHQIYFLRGSTSMNPHALRGRRGANQIIDLVDNEDITNKSTSVPPRKKITSQLQGVRDQRSLPGEVQFLSSKSEPIALDDDSVDELTQQRPHPDHGRQSPQVFKHVSVPSIDTPKSQSNEHVAVRVDSTKKGHVARAEETSKYFLARSSPKKETKKFRVMSLTSWTKFDYPSDLLLEYDHRGKAFTIVNDYGSAEEQIAINSIVSCECCLVELGRKVRLKGSRDTRVKATWYYDLEFSSPEDARSFCIIVKEEAPKDVLREKSLEKMDGIFQNKPNQGIVNMAEAVDEAAEVRLLTAKQEHWKKEMRECGAKGSKAEKLERLRRRNLDAPMRTLHSAQQGDLPMKTENQTDQKLQQDRGSTFLHVPDVADGPDMQSSGSRQKSPTSPDTIPPYDFGSPWDEPLVFPEEGKRRVTVNFEDLERLTGEIMLNDNLVEFYLRWLTDEFPNPKVYFFGTHFYTALTSGARGGINYAAVARWTTKEDIFSYDHVIIPVNEATHWYLAIICNLKEALRENKEFEDPEFMPPMTPTSSLNQSVMSILRGDMSSSRKLAPEGKGQSNEDPIALDEVEPSATEPRSSLSQPCSDLGEEYREGVPFVPEGSIALGVGEQNKLGLSRPVAESGVFSNVKGNVISPTKPKRKPSSSRKKRDITQPSIVIFDSLGLARSKTISNLKEYLMAEAKEKKSMDITKDKFKGMNARSGVPLQSNSTDCGVFVCGYVHRFMVSPQEFVGKLLRQEFDLETDWPNMNPRAMREAMRGLLLGLEEEQKKHRLARKEAKRLRKQAQQTAGGDGESSPAVEGKDDSVLVQEIARQSAEPTPQDSCTRPSQQKSPPPCRNSRSTSVAQKENEDSRLHTMAVSDDQTEEQNPIAEHQSHSPPQSGGSRAEFRQEDGNQGESEMLFTPSIAAHTKPLLYPQFMKLSDQQEQLSKAQSAGEVFPGLPATINRLDEERMDADAQGDMVMEDAYENVAG